MSDVETIRKNQQAMRRALKRTRYMDGPSMFDRRGTSRNEMLRALLDIALKHDLSSDEQAFIGGLRRAILGETPYHHLEVRRAKEGSKIRSAEKIASDRQTKEIADAIDIAVANGKPQKAAVADAMESFGLSRAEIYRQLKKGRRKRREGIASLSEANREALSYWYVPDGFDIDTDDKLQRIEGPTRD